MSCPSGASEQQWWPAAIVGSDGKTITPTSSDMLQIQGGDCGSWLAFIHNGATATYADLDLGTREGEMRLRVLVGANDAATPNGGTLTLFADADLVNKVTSCDIKPTGGWFNWVTVDCGPIQLTGKHTLTFAFAGSAQYVFNLAAFGVVRSGSADCTVTGPKPP